MLSIGETFNLPRFAHQAKNVQNRPYKEFAR